MHDIGDNQGRNSHESFRVTRRFYGLDPDSEDIGDIPFLFKLGLVAVLFLFMVTGVPW